MRQHPYLHSPAEMMGYVMHQVMSCDTTSWPEVLKPLLQLLHKYREMGIDLDEAHKLLGLGLGWEVVINVLSKCYDVLTDYTHACMYLYCFAIKSFWHEFSFGRATNAIINYFLRSY